MAPSSTTAQRPLIRRQQLFACLFATAFPLTASAATRSYTGGDGSLFATATNWNPNGVPGSGDVLTLGSTAISGLSGDLHVTLNGVFTGITSVTFDSSALPGGFIINETGGTLGATTETLTGGATDNAYNQSQGSANTVSTLNIAGGTSSDDLYALSSTGTALTVSSNLNLGQAGTGTLTETDGSVTVHNSGNTAALTLGVNSGSSGTYTLSSGTLSTDILTVGSAGTAVLNQSGSGSVSVTGTATLSSTAGTATYNYSGGTATFSSGLTVGTHGTFNLQSGSSLGFAVAVNTGGTLNLAGGSLGTGAAANLNGGTLQTLGHSPTFTSLSGSGTIDNGSTTTASTLTLNPASAATFSGQIVDGSTKSLGLTLSAGTYTLSGDNTYSGTTTIQGGTLKMGSVHSLSTSSPVVLNGGTLDTQTFGGSIPSLAGSSTATVNANGTNNALEIGSSLANTTYSGAFTGAGVIQKVGASTLTLSGNGAASTFTGIIEDDGGALAVGATDGIPTGVEVDINNATLGVPFTQHIATFFSTASSPIVFTNSASLITGSSNVNTTVGAYFLGTGTFIKNGTGTTTMGEGSSDTLANTGFSVSTTVNAGTLALDKASSTTAIAGDLVINGGTVQDLATGQISTSSNITVNGPGVLDLNGFSELPNSVTLDGGTIKTGAGSISIGSSFSVLASSTTAAVTGNFDLDGFQTFDVASGTTPSGIDLNLQAIVSNGFVTKTDNGLLNLSGNNTFTGGLNINAGVVRLANAGALNSSTPNAVNFSTSSTGTLRLNGNSVTVAGLTTDPTTPGTPTVENASSTAATLTINNASASTYAGVIRDGTGGGALSLTKSGAGTLTLAGSTANTFTGTTKVSAGTLALDKASGTAAIAGNLTINGGTVQDLATGQISTSSNVTVAGPGVLDLNGFYEFPNSVTLDAGTIKTGAGSISIGSSFSVLATSATAVVSGNFDLLGFQTFDVASGTTPSGSDLDLQAVVSDGYVTKSGSGLLNLSGNNTFTGGLNINAGVVRLANAGALNSSTPNAVNFSSSSTGTLRLNGNSVTISGLTTDPSTPGTPKVQNTSSTAATLTINNASASTYAGVIQDGTGGGALSLTKAGAGALTLTGTNTYSGPTVVQAGSLLLNSAGALPVGDALTLSGGSAAVANHGTNPTTLLQLSSLNFGGTSSAPTGQLDLANNDMIVHGGNMGNIFSQLKSGFNAGGSYWNGPGIISSAAQGDTKFLTTLGVLQPTTAGTFDNQSYSAGDVLVKYTYYGDADLNGTVNGADYQQIDMGFGMGLTGWSNGDFNYDGVVDGSDYSLIDNTFNQITATGASPLAVTAGAADVIAQAVPEPTTVALLGAASAAFLARRRRYFH